MCTARLAYLKGRIEKMAFRTITGLVRDVRAAHRVSHEIDFLTRLSSDQLAERGLDRSEITSYAFNKYFKR